MVHIFNFCQFFTEVTDFSLTARWQSKQNLQLTRGFTNGKRRARERNGEKMALPFPQKVTVLRDIPVR